MADLTLQRQIFDSGYNHLFHYYQSMKMTKANIQGKKAIPNLIPLSLALDRH